MIIINVFYDTDIQPIHSKISKWYYVKGILQKYCMVADIYACKNVDIIKTTHLRNSVTYAKKQNISVSVSKILHPYYGSQ